jgi:hypothetical protein
MPRKPVAEAASGAVRNETRKPGVRHFDRLVVTKV